MRQIGKGFIINDIGGIIGRKLTESFVDQYNRTYVKIDGQMTPLTEQHSYLAMD